jgi:hypothetical protein
MKHLILFEGFETDEYYQVTSYPYDEKYVYFDISTIREISKLIPNYSYKYERAINLGGPSLTFVCKHPTNGPRSVIVRQMRDEWFIVTLQFEDERLRLGGTLSYHFKCDQVGGIEKLLQDKKVI